MCRLPHVSPELLLLKETYSEGGSIGSDHEDDEMREPEVSSYLNASALEQTPVVTRRSRHQTVTELRSWLGRHFHLSDKVFRH
jgi:hypothetical protein